MPPKPWPKDDEKQTRFMLETVIENMQEAWDKNRDPGIPVSFAHEVQDKKDGPQQGPDDSGPQHKLK